MEELMRRAVQNKFNPSYRTEYRAVMAAYEFWKLYDILKRRSCAKAFARLYLQDGAAETQVKLSIELGVGERTLLRYRKQFVRSFVYMLDSLKQEESLQEAR